MHALLARAGPSGSVPGRVLEDSALATTRLGGTLPLALGRRGLGPAIAAGPTLTTVTDTCGFFFTLAPASGLLRQLTA